MSCLFANIKRGTVSRCSLLSISMNAFLLSEKRSGSAESIRWKGGFLVDFVGILCF